MIDALIQGRVCGTPTQKTAKNGSPYVIAKVRTPMPDGGVLFANVITFRESVINALMALADGDSVCLSGELSIKTYTGKDGTVRPSLDLQAHALISEYHVTRKRRAMAAEKADTATATSDSELPFDDQF
jgi:single-stranded DNA-binding protein